MPAAIDASIKGKVIHYYHENSKLNWSGYSKDHISAVYPLSWLSIYPTTKKFSSTLMKDCQRSMKSV